MNAFELYYVGNLLIGMRSQESRNYLMAQFPLQKESAYNSELAIMNEDSKVWNNRDAIYHTVTNGKSVYAHGAGLVFENLGIKKTRVFSETGKRITAAT